MIALRPSPALLSLLLLAPAPLAEARLPELNVQPWYGHFIGLQTRAYQFGLASTTKGSLGPIGRRGDPVPGPIQPTLTFVIEETTADGRVVARRVNEDSLKTEDAATTTLAEPVSFTGSTTGDATFAATVSLNRGVISIAAKMTDPGTLKGDPRLVVRIYFPSSYRYVTAAQRETREFQRRVKDDKLNIRYGDGSRLRQSTGDVAKLDDDQFNAKPISEVKVEMDAFQGKSFTFTATGESKFALWNSAEAAIHDGFSINWIAPPADKDPNGEAQLTIEIR